MKGYKEKAEKTSSHLTSLMISLIFSLVPIFCFIPLGDYISLNIRWAVPGIGITGVLAGLETMAHIRGKTFTWKPVFTRLRNIFLFFCLMGFYALTSKLLTWEGFSSKIELDIMFFSTISTLYLVLVSTFSKAVAKKL